MNSFIAKNKFILVLTALVICLSMAYGLTTKLDPIANAYRSTDDAAQYNLSQVASVAAQYLGETSSPAGYHGYGVATPPSSTGFAGAYLGYLSPGTNDSFFTIAGLNSGNSVSYSYLTLSHLSDFMTDSAGTGYGSSNPTAWEDSAIGYVGYGYALQACGIDETIIIGKTADNKRNIFGPLALIIFLLSAMVGSFFELVLTFLSVANPFRLFLGSGSVLYGITPRISAGPGFTNQNGTISGAMSNALTALANTVTGLYNTLYNLSFMAVIPIMIAIALFSWLVLRHPAKNAFKKLLIRVVFIGLGVPLLLACYTAAIDSVKDFMIDSGTGTPISVILATFCDYGDWALGEDASASDAYALPAGVTLQVDTTGSAFRYKIEDSTSDRRIVQLINSTVSRDLSSHRTLRSAQDAQSIASDDKDLVTSTAGVSSEAQIKAVIDLLQKYTRGEYITAANFAAKFNKHYASFPEATNVIFNLSNNWRAYEPELAVPYKFEVADGHATTIDMDASAVKEFAEKRMTGSGALYYAGALNMFVPPTSGAMSLVRNGIYIGNAGYAAGAGPMYGASPRVSPMSKLAAYNMASSVFSDTEVTVYSSEATSTDQQQLAHYTVSLAGAGYMEVAYFIDAIAIMSCLMVLGYGYGFSLLFACFKGLIQIFPKVLTGMIGSIRGIAGTVALVACLIVEIIGTCIMYALGSLFIGHIYDLIETPIAILMSNTALNLPPQAASLITVVASFVIIVKLTQTLLHYRTAVVKATSESATAFINKFMETNVVAPNLEGFDGKAAAGAALGTAMVLGSSPAGSKLADRATEELTDKLNNLDGEKVASAAMTGATRTGDHGEKYSSAEAKQAATSSGTYIDNSASESSAPQTDDAKAADYVASNEDDFENEIGYAGTGGTSHSAPAAASDDGDYDEDDKEIRGSKIADNSNDLENSGPNMTGTVTNADGSREEYQNGRLVAAYDSKGNKIIDNSTEELTGTKTTDITGTEKGESDKGHTTASGNTIDSSASKFVMTDANGNSQEVQIVNAKTGQAYTQADKDAGANYDVIDAQGNSIYPNVQGGMSSNTLAMTNGEPAMMVGPGSNGTSPYGGGGVYQLSQAPTPAPVDAGVTVATPQPAASGAAPQVNQPVTQNTTQNIVQTNNDNTSTSHVQNTTQNTSESVMQNVTQSGGDVGASMAGSPIIVGGQESAATVIQQGNNATPNVNVSVSERGASTPAQTTVQQDFVQNITQTGNGGGYVQAPASPSGGSTVVNNTYNTQHTTQNTENTTNMTNNNVMNESGSARAGLGTGSIPNGPSRRA